MTDRMRLSEKLDEVLGLADKATPGEWQQAHRKTLTGGYSTEVFDEAGKAIATLAWHAVPLNETTTTTDREDNAKLITAAINLLREHGDELRQALRDSERLRAAPVVEVPKLQVHTGLPKERWKPHAIELPRELAGQRVRLVIEDAAMGRREGEG